MPEENEEEIDIEAVNREMMLAEQEISRLKEELNKVIQEIKVELSKRESNSKDA